MNYVFDYIREAIGINVIVDNQVLSHRNKLPLFLEKGFEFKGCMINGKRVVFAKPHDEDIPTPEQLKIHSQSMEGVFNCPIVFVLDNIEAYKRARLIKRRVAFVVRDKQMYIPSLFIDLSEIQRPKSRQSEFISPSTQFILVYHLWKESLEGMSFSEVADLLSYSKMTISRSVKELVEMGVCKQTHTKEKFLYFTGDKQEIWNRSIEKAKSPIKKEIWIEELQPTEELPVSGINALSKYSMLSQDRHDVYAISSEGYKQLKREQKIIGENHKYGHIKLEIWGYDPKSLSQNNIVDPFSLYLALKDDPYERVEISLNEMMDRLL
ncbi:MAG: hypothetical protein N4A35_01395 [Flavobacteriales bacterium]|jgi:DNA-binding transcriptional regulator GbsR (MarR family)|nr:hypothetical protein [Flavobacteriales bacterium]